LRLVREAGADQRASPAPALLHCAPGLREGEGEIATVERATVALLGEATAASMFEIDAALARLEAGTFGVCEGRGKQIPSARLEVRPPSSRCVPCASHQH